MLLEDFHERTTVGGERWQGVVTRTRWSLRGPALAGSRRPMRSPQERHSREWCLHSPAQLPSISSPNAMPGLIWGVHGAGIVDRISAAGMFTAHIHPHVQGDTSKVQGAPPSQGSIEPRRALLWIPAPQEFSHPGAAIRGNQALAQLLWSVMSGAAHPVPQRSVAGPGRGLFTAADSAAPRRAVRTAPPRARPGCQLIGNPERFLFERVPCRHGAPRREDSSLHK